MSICIHIYIYIWTYWKSILSDSCFPHQYYIIFPLFFSGSASREFVCLNGGPRSRREPARGSGPGGVAVMLCHWNGHAIDGASGWLFKAEDGMVVLIPKSLGDFEIFGLIFFFFRQLEIFWSLDWLGWFEQMTTWLVYMTVMCVVYIQKF